MRARAPRVLRGGAFNNELQNVRVAVRNRNNPDNRNRNNGFRFVVRTFFQGQNYPTALGAFRLRRKTAELVPGRAR